MKHIGLVGGLSPESTVHYYKTICDSYNRAIGGVAFPQITIRSINLQDIVDLFPENRWDDIADIVISAINDLSAAGAEFAAITTNTVHNAIERIKQFSPIPVLSITSATAEAVKKDGHDIAGLLGTRPTMEYGFFQKEFNRHGITILTPEREDREYVNNVIWEELVHGQVHEKSRRKYLDIINRLGAKGAKGVILGCTEIPMLIKQEECPLKIYDTTDIHAKAILNYALQ